MGKGGGLRVARMLGILLTICVLGVACDVAGGGYAKIGEIGKNPSQFDGREVKIRGKVIDVLKVPLIETKTYLLQDDTGEIRVITKGGTPGLGSEVRVRGTVQTVAIVGGKSAGLHLKELQRW